MRVVLLTQDEPLFLGPSIDYLLSRTPAGITVAGCVAFDPSPLGKKVGSWQTLAYVPAETNYEFVTPAS